jgi:excisionase family DNA binding protein
MRKFADALWTVEDLADYIAVPVRDIHELVAQRCIPHFKIGEHLRFRRSEIDRWLACLAVPCLDSASRPLARPHVSHKGSTGKRSFPLDVSPSLPPATPQPQVPSAPSLPLPLPDPTKRRPALAAPLGDDDDGPEDKYIQKLVQQIGEENGFRVTLNEMVPGGRASVDVALERDGWRLACEISLTSNLEQEIATIRKCLESGFDEVAMVLPNERQARKLESALSEALSPEERAQVRLLRPAELRSYIEEIETVVCERETTVGQWKVKVKYVRLNPAETARRYQAIVEVIARALRREIVEKRRDAQSTPHPER